MNREQRNLLRLKRMAKEIMKQLVDSALEQAKTKGSAYLVLSHIPDVTIGVKVTVTNGNKYYTAWRIDGIFTKKELTLHRLTQIMAERERLDLVLADQPINEQNQRKR